MHCLVKEAFNDDTNDIVVPPEILEIVLQQGEQSDINTIAVNYAKIRGQLKKE